MGTAMSNIWGPHPKYAILPVILVLGVIGWLAAENPGPIERPAAQPVTAMKPIVGTEAAAQPMPIEVRYGVPTERTLHLWPRD
jgi:hypothetical protein